MFITRPRCFGKTFTMSTFYDFLAFEFDKSGDISWLENGLKELKSLMIKNSAVNSWSDFLKAYRQLGSFRKCLVVLLRIKFFQRTEIVKKIVFVVQFLTTQCCKWLNNKRMIKKIKIIVALIKNFYIMVNINQRTDGRAVECTGLENRRRESVPEFESQSVRHSF